MAALQLHESALQRGGRGGVRRGRGVTEPEKINASEKIPRLGPQLSDPRWENARVNGRHAGTKESLLPGDHTSRNISQATNTKVMPHLNKVMLLGNLTRDPELRATPKGTSVAQFGLAINRLYKSEDGESREETTFVDLEAWGRQAEVISRYLTKGSPCLVEGRLRLDTWEDKASGEKRSRLRVVAENIQFLDRRGPEAETAAEPQPETRNRSREGNRPAAGARPARAPSRPAVAAR